MNDPTLEQRVEALFTSQHRSPEAKSLLAEIRQLLSNGALRVAEPPKTNDGSTAWKVNAWVKKAIYLMATLGELQNITDARNGNRGIDLDTLPWRQTPPPLCRVPPGSFIREGAYIAPGVTCMPPSILQIGSFVDAGCGIDSMVNIGIGAQIGKRVQLSCQATVGGWLAPFDQPPTIIEDDVLLGAGAGVYDGAQIGQGAVLLAGTQIIPALGLLDLKTGRLLQREPGQPLRVPPYAIVAMGSRAAVYGAMLHLPLIVGRRRGKDPREWEEYLNLSFSPTSTPNPLAGIGDR